MSAEVGRVEGKDDAQALLRLLGLALEPLGPEIEQHIREREQIAMRPLLESRQRRLRGEGSFSGDTSERQLECRIVAQSGGVVRVFVAGTDQRDALHEQVTHCVLNSRRVPAIDHRRRQPVGQSETLVDPMEESDPAVGGQPDVVEGSKSQLEGSHLRSSLPVGNFYTL